MCSAMDSETYSRIISRNSVTISEFVWTVIKQLKYYLNTEKVEYYATVLQHVAVVIVLVNFHIMKYFWTHQLPNNEDGPTSFKLIQRPNHCLYYLPDKCSTKHPGNLETKAIIILLIGGITFAERYSKTFLLTGVTCAINSCLMISFHVQFN